MLSISNPVTINGGGSEKKKNSSFVGRISQEKGVDKILEVWRGICHEEKYKEWRLVIVGDGEKENKWKSMQWIWNLLTIHLKDFKSLMDIMIKQRFFVWLQHLKGLD